MNYTNYLLAIVSDDNFVKSAAARSKLEFLYNFAKGLAQPILKAKGTAQQVAGAAMQKLPIKSVAQKGVNLAEQGTKLVDENALGNAFARGNGMPAMQRAGRIIGAGTIGMPLYFGTGGAAHYLTGKYLPVNENMTNEAIAKGEREGLASYAGQIQPGMISGLDPNARTEMVDFIGKNNTDMRNAMILSGTVPYNIHYNAGTETPPNYPRELINKTTNFIEPFLNSTSIRALMPDINNDRPSLQDWSKDQLNNKIQQRQQTTKSGSSRGAWVSKALNFLKSTVTGKGTSPGAALTSAGISALAGFSRALSDREEAARSLGRGNVDATVYNALQNTKDPKNRDFLDSLIPNNLNAQKSNNIINSYKVLAPSIKFRPPLNAATNTNSDFTKLDPNAGQKPNFGLGNQ